MNACRINTVDDFIDSIIRICDESSNLDLNLGSIFIQDKLIELIKNARESGAVNNQLGLLKKALEQFYNISDDEYGLYLSEMYPKGYAFALFDPNYDKNLAEKLVPSDIEGRAKASKILRLRNFLESKFKNSPNAKLYFKRSVKNDMVETFLVKRSGDSPRYFTSQEDMNANVRAYKQELLDRIFEYFDNDHFLRDTVKTLPRVMYKDGKYTGVVETIRSVINSRLAPEYYAEGKVKSLESYYKDYRDGDALSRKHAERLLNAYNAWITLQSFDTVVEDSFGTIIKVNLQDFNGHTGDLTKYEIRGRATNMWNNWTTSDDIADMSEVISDVTQTLIETSRMYRWGSNEAYPDRYVSFADFNYVIGLIKKHAFDPTNDSIVLSSLKGIENTSLYTKKILLEILSWNRANGNFQKTVDGKLTTDPKEVTWKQLVSRINENPLRYLHAVFDILCNTQILKQDKFQYNDYEKSLIWSFNKEVFGGDGNSRSLYNLHTTTKLDNVYQIITLVAASTFPEDYLQYYEKNDGTISTRLLLGYALESIKNLLFLNIQETAITMSKELYEKYGVTYQESTEQPGYLNQIDINIPISSDLVFHINTTSSRVQIDNYTDVLWDLIWKDHKIQQMFKEVLGLNFEDDPDFKNAYMEIVKSSYGALQDLGSILGRVMFNSVVNTEFVPKHPSALTTASALKTFLHNLYPVKDAISYELKFDRDTYIIPVLPATIKDAALGSLSMAKAINSNLLAQAQSKTGEGTSLANYTLSRMRNFYQNLIEMQCKKERSSVKDLSFVVNANGLFEGILSRRELKMSNSNQQSTQFSDQQSFQLSFINDFIAGFVPNPDENAHIKKGRVSFLPTVNSDKTQIDGLLVNLNAKTHIPNGLGGFKTYLELTDSEIELEMELEFKPMYERIIKNINRELTRVYQELLKLNQRLAVEGKVPYELDVVHPRGTVITYNQSLLNAINKAFATREDLGKKPKQRITNGLHLLITEYNKTHTRNPIMLSSHVHYVFDDNGLLSSNKTLEALWGRFNPNMTQLDRARLQALYSKETGYISILERAGMADPLSSSSFFKYQDYLTVKDLLDMNFKIYLNGSDEVVRKNLPEIQFLKGEAVFTDLQKINPEYKHLIELNDEMKNWVDSKGFMIIAKGLVDGVLTNITTIEQLNKAKNLQMHPMLSKLNRLDYLCTQQYTISTVGSHYVHKGGAKEGSILVEEAKRWLASNKRNVAATSTVHLFQNKQLDGAPSVYNVSIIEDVRFDLYNVMGDLYLEGHAPLDGGMFVNAWVSPLENNSLAGEAAGWDKKQFGTFYSELYGAGGIVKTAGFAASNARMRRLKAWQNLQKNMSNKVWVKEYPDANGNDIPEVIDITKNYFQKSIDYTQAIKGQSIMYKRPAHDKPRQLAAYKNMGIKYLGNNTYEILEVEIDSYGNPIGEPVLRQEFDENGKLTTAIKVNTNWDLYTKVFGGFNSLEIGHDNRLTWSENSIQLMVYALNNVGYAKDSSKLKLEDYGQFGNGVYDDIEQHSKTLQTGLDLDDVWQPLKYSDIHYTPNIGAIKSLLFNVNPDGDAVLNSETTMNFMTMRLALLGIQLDKEHHADESDVSMPTQIIQALSNRSYTSEYAKEVNKALAVLTRQVTQPFLDGIKDIIDADPNQPNSQAKLVEEVSNLILESLSGQNNEDTSVNALLSKILEKAERGEKLSFSKDLLGKVPWSDPTIHNKLFSAVSTTLTNLAVKMKFAGILSVICPTDRVEKIYGDRLLHSFTKIYDDNGSTRTELSEVALDEYQKSVAAGNEVDSDGHNMLIFDITRDSIEFPSQGEAETVEQYLRRIRRDSARHKLSKIAELKTQHNYVIEFEDGSWENITINTPEDYFKVKNVVVVGKSSVIQGLDSIKVSKIYENVKEGRALGAYNVRFSGRMKIEDGTIQEHRFQIFDLDSINLAFKLNNLITDPKKAVSGYKLFQENSIQQQQAILNQIFRSSAFAKDILHTELQKVYSSLPAFDENFMANITQMYPRQVYDIIKQLYTLAKPITHKRLQRDLFKLSANYTKADRSVFVNGRKVDPFDILSDAYELIMPKIYQTQFGLQEFDDLQEILRDKDFFIKRGLSRFQCKASHTDYDYELKNFNGDHFYILDKSKGIPDHVAKQLQQIFVIQKQGKFYRTDSDGQIMYEMSSEDDFVCKVGNVQIIVTENPLFYVLNLNYNTLKVSPKRVTQESYELLTSTLAKSKRVNSKNFLKAITDERGEYFLLAEFKKFNELLDNLTYNDLIAGSLGDRDYKSLLQICKIILKNGRELHTAFNESLNVIAGRIPAQSQQSFMTQRVIGFDSSDINTAMVSTFQLFLQGSDLDIDAVTLLGYEFDKNGKFVAWSPYFNASSKEMLYASKEMPLPTGEIQEITASEDSETNFFEVYDKYFGTLFKPIILESGLSKTVNGVLELLMDTNTPEGMRLLAEFLKDFNKYGVSIKAPIKNGLVDTTDTNFFKKIITLDDGSLIEDEWNLFKRPTGTERLIGARPDLTYAMAQQVLKFANDHNDYLNTAEEHLRDKMAKNYIVHYIYKVAESPCNQTEAQVSVDVPTEILRTEAGKSKMAEDTNTHAPGRVTSKTRSVGEGQAGKSGVGIGAVGIKANSTTLFYLSEIINYGSDWDRDKILFKNPVVINRVVYTGFANMFTNKQFSEEDLIKYQKAFEIIDSIDDPSQVTNNVAVNIAAMLSIAVDNAKDLVLAKINSGPRLMGMYVYGLTLGVPIETLSAIMRSEEGMILKEMMEGSLFNNDTTAFKVLDVFDKLKGNIARDLQKYSYLAKDKSDKPVVKRTNIRVGSGKLQYGSTLDTLFAAMYPIYHNWYALVRDKLPRQFGKVPKEAISFGGMLQHLIQMNAFDWIYHQAIPAIEDFSNKVLKPVVSKEAFIDWEASKEQIVAYISDISKKAAKFRSFTALDLRVLAEGAEEMRILGSILSINKGLKASASDTETFIDTIENLIYDRKKILGLKVSEDDKIDFIQFMFDEDYQKDVIERYEKVKHSVNIPHLLTKAPHFQGYLKTQTIPVAFFTASSVKYRTMHKYRKNAFASYRTTKSISIFDLFEVDGKKEKEMVLKGLENLVQFRLLTRWAKSKDLHFKVPVGFKYFTRKGQLDLDLNEELTIPLYTEEGLATFKKYMEEIFIPMLTSNPSLSKVNTFIKNLTKISYNKTPVHSSVTTYSLHGDLMARVGRQAELNAKMFADFQQLATIKFQPEMGIPSIVDAFYLYAQYCYMGKKGLKSLMCAFDSSNVISEFVQSFNTYVSTMDAEGIIDCSKEDLIVWCAPYGGLRLRSKYGYVTSNRFAGVSLKQRISENVHLTEELQEAMEEARELAADDDEQGARKVKAEKFVTYKSSYLATQYDRITRNNFLVPIVDTNEMAKHIVPVNVLGYPVNMTVKLQKDVVQDLSLELETIEDVLSADVGTSLDEIVKLNQNFIEKFGNLEAFEQSLLEVLKQIHLPYRVALFSNSKEIDLRILQTLIEQQLNC